MKTLIVGIGIVGSLLVAVPALAVTDSATQDSVTKNQPFVFEFEHVQAGENLAVFAFWQRENTDDAYLAITGPATCSVSVDASAFDVRCVIENAPAGTYTATLSVDRGKLHDATMQSVAWTP